MKIKMQQKECNKALEEEFKDFYKHCSVTISLSKILQEYLKYRSGEAEDYLFCSAYGAKLTTNAIEHSISKYNRRREVMKTSIHLNV